MNSFVQNFSKLFFQDNLTRLSGIMMILYIGLFSSMSGFAQTNPFPEVTVTPPLPIVSGNEFSICAQERNVRFTITASDTQTITNGLADFFVYESIDGDPGPVLIPAIGFTIGDPVAVSPYAVPASWSFDGDGNMIDIEIPDLDSSEIYEFEIPLRFNCDFGQGGAEIVQVVLGLEVDSDPGENLTPVDNDALADITQADFSQVSTLYPPEDWQFMEVYLGMIDTLSLDVRNAATAWADTVFYCIQNNSSTVVNQLILVDPITDSVVVVPAAGNTIPVGDSTCFILHSVFWDSLFGVPYFPASRNIEVQEVHEVVNCGPNEIFWRTVRYGCQGSMSCLMKPLANNFLNTSIIWGEILPELAAEITQQTQPACYNSTNSEIIVTISNPDTAQVTAEDVVVSFDPAHGIVPLATWMPSQGTSNLIADPNGTCGDQFLLDTITGVNLAPGESMTVTFEVDHDCGCIDPGTCSITDLFGGVFVVEAVSDECENYSFPTPEFQPITLSLIELDATMNSFNEPPASFMDGEEECFTHTLVTSVFTMYTEGNFPNAEFELLLDIPDGVDYVSGSLVWRDADGTEWFPDTDWSDGASTMTAIWELGSPPADFSTAAPGIFTYCLIGDQAEVEPVSDCVPDIIPLDFVLMANYITDPACDACQLTPIFCPDPYSSVFITMPPMVGPCSPTPSTCEFFGLQRVNFGLDDVDNNKLPDGDPSNQHLRFDNRFIQGDSIKATFIATVSNTLDDSLVIGTARIIMDDQISSAGFTPYAAQVIVWDADQMEYDTCNVVPYSKDFTASDTAILVDFSIPTLADLGCGFNPNFDKFQTGDSIFIYVNFQIKEEFTGSLRTLNFPTEISISEPGDPAPVVSSCPGILTQIGLSSSRSFVFQNFGGCGAASPPWGRITETYVLGGSLDEFPYEVRSIAMPKTVVFNKPSELSYDLTAFVASITNVSASPIPAEYLIISGDQVNFLAEDYFNSLGNVGIPPDEGFVFVYDLGLTGTCETAQGPYPVSYTTTISTNTNIFCTNEIVKPMVHDTFDYVSGADWVVVDPGPPLRVCSTEEAVRINVRNNSTSTAVNSFFYLNAPGGNIIIHSVTDVTNGNVVLTPNPFGIYSAGDIPGNDMIEYDVVVTLNECGPVPLEIISGWACDEVPETIDEAGCVATGTVFLATPDAKMNLNALQPSTNSVIQPCDTIIYEWEGVSTDLGFIRDPEVIFAITGNAMLDTNSIEIAYPSITSPLTSGYISIPAPEVFNEKWYRVTLGDFFADLEDHGLPGSKDLNRNRFSIRYKALTDCNTRGRGRSILRYSGKTPCGDEVRPRIKKDSPRWRLKGSRRSFAVRFTLPDAEIDACASNQINLDVGGIITRGNTSSQDSISFQLPSGVQYVTDSYTNNPKNNMPFAEPVIRLVADGTELLWPMESLSRLDEFVFSIDVVVDDPTILDCITEKFCVSAFGSYEDICSADGQPCIVRDIAEYKCANLEVTKAEIIFDVFDVDVSIDPVTGTAEGSFDIEVCNVGQTVPMGTELTFEIYEDIDGDGDHPDPNGGDPNPDVLVTTLTETLAADLLPGTCVSFTLTQTFPAADFCNLYALLTPSSSCVCSGEVSNLSTINIDFDFETEYEACSIEDVLVGPLSVTGFNYEWLSFEGSNLANLSAIDITPVTFSMPNTTGAVLTVQYLLRSATAMDCYSLDTISINVFPETNIEHNVMPCEGASFNLPAAPSGGSNYVWTPSTGLSFPGPDPSFAVIDNVLPGLNTYVLTYIGADGCPASITYNVTGIDCGPIPAALGDTVWFDFDNNGMQDIGEPGIENVLVELINPLDGSVFSSTYTDENGFYIFENLPPYSSYIVRFVPQDGFIPTIQDASGVSDALDSDADPITGETGTYTLMADTILTVDAGFIPNCNIDLEVLSVTCVPSDSGSVSKIMVNVNWAGNPYTYNQFPPGEDILTISILGNDYLVVADTLFGDTTLTVYAGSSFQPPTELNATAAFTLADDCIAYDSTTMNRTCVFDLALTKTINNDMIDTLYYGDNIEFTITVYNQGDEATSQIEITDYMPDGYSFSTGDNLGWMNFGAFLVYTADVILLPGESVEIPLILTINNEPSEWLNIAEISAFQDTSGYDVSELDVDSTPDQDPNNDAGGAVSTASDDVVDGDGTGAPGDTDPATDEDDADPALFEIFDLALRKTIVTFGPYNYGDPIEFEITVFNQGSVIAQDILITDDIPAGFSFNAALSPAWTPSGSQATTTLAGPLMPGDSLKVNITLDLVMANFDEYTNQAEITEARDTSDTIRMDDVDSTPDDDFTNDPGGGAGTDSDNAIFGDGTGTPGDNDPATDEDDADPAYVAVPLIDLTKTTVSTGPAASMTPNNYDVVFELSIENIGNEELIEPFLVDSLAVYFGSAWVGIVSGPTITQSVNIDPTINPAYDGEIDVELLNGNGGSILPGETLTIEFGIEISEIGDYMNIASVDAVDSLFTPTEDSDTSLLEIPAVSLGSTVWLDDNNDGDQDVDEDGMEGVVVNLYADTDGSGDFTPGDSLVATTTTDVDGNYFFEGLQPGDYIVGVVPPVTTALSSDYNGTSGEMDPDNDTDNVDDGFQLNAGDEIFSLAVTLESFLEPTNAVETAQGGDQDDAEDESGNMTVDFGLYPGMSIGSTVFADNDNDGIHEPGDGENGIPGVLVYLLADDGMTVLDSTVTNSDGDYFFGSLPEGTYYVAIPETAFGVDEGLEGYPISSTPTFGEADDQEDENDNGIQDNGPGTMVISSAIELLIGDEPVGAAESGSGGTLDDIEDANGDMTIDFGFFPNMSIGSTVWADTNEDGLLNNGEQGVDSIPVTLWSPGPDGIPGNGDDVVIAMDTTDANGDYFFDELTPGDYYISLIPPDSLNLSSPADVTDTNDNGEDNDDNGIQTNAGDPIVSPVITLTPGTEPMGTEESGQGGDQDDGDDMDDDGDMTIDFGLVPSVSIGSNVWVDANNDGLQDGTEDPVGGVEVNLYADADMDGVPDGAPIATTTTDASGDYFFDGLSQGNYIVGVVPPVTLDLSSTPTGGEADDQTDDNDNGIQLNPGDEILSSTINLTSNMEPLDGDESGSGGMQDSLDDDNGDMTVDFGLLPSVSLGSTVFADIDNNNVQDSGESGVPGVTVILYDDLGNVVATTVTDADGDYFFDGLVPGDYSVGIVPPNNLPLSSDDGGSEMDPNADIDGNDNGFQMNSGDTIFSNLITLTPFMEPIGIVEAGQGGDQDDLNDDSGNMTLDFGLYPGMSIGSTVFADNDNDGIHEPGDGENGLPGVLVYLLADDGMTVLDSTVTNSDGDYFFGGLPEGSYFISIPASAFGEDEGLEGYPISSTPTFGEADDQIDENDNGIQDGGPGAMVISSEIVLTIGDEPVGAAESGSGGTQDDFDDANGDMTIDFGFFPNMSIGSTVWADENQDGLLNNGESGVASVILTLLTPGPDGIPGNGDDVLIGTDTTDVNGDYFFDGLAPGDYYVSLIPPDSLNLSSPPDVTNTNDDQMDDDDNGSQVEAGSPIISPIITLIPGTEPEGEPGQGGDQDDGDDMDDDGDMTIDFGLVPSVSVGSYVWYDENNNSMNDPGEVAIPEILVELWSPGPDGVIGGSDDILIAADTTDMNGLYFFDGLFEGDYYIQIPMVPSDYSLSSNGNGGDDQTQDDDNGIQSNGPGSPVNSVIFNLDAGNELVEDGTQPGDDQDDLFDLNGDMTFDFGFVCYVQLICPAIPDTLTQHNDPGWCQALVNIPYYEIVTCDGAMDTIVEFMLEGAGVQGLPNNTWIEGQPNGLMYDVGMTNIYVRGQIPSLGFISDTCELVIIILDKQNPDAVCQDIEIYLDAMGVASIVADDIDGGSYDNCELASVEADVLNFDCATLGANQVLLIATDTAGNADSCFATVTVLDTIPPSFECPDDEDVSICVGIVPDLISGLEATDNCDESLVTFSQDPAEGVAFGNASGDTLVVTITATDGSGNEISCEVVLTIVDDEDPYFQNCPGALVFCNDVDECGATINWSQPVAFDNCDDSLEVVQTMGPVPGSFFPVGTVETIEYTATDDDGNEITCTFTIEVEDCQNPDAICQDINVYLDAMGVVSIVADDIDGGSYDNCELASLEANVLSFDCTTLGANPVVLTATDASGNADSCVATVTVLDTIPPTFECPGPMNVGDCVGIIPDLISELQGGDNCGTVTFSQDPAAGVAFGNVSGDTIVVTITATDGSGNETSCEVVITIVDGDDPYFQNCPGDLVFCNDVDQCGATLNWSQPVAFDNCDDSLEVIQTMGPAPGSFFPVGTVETIEYTATDDEGNTITCTFTVEVEDCQNPDAICEDITVYLDGMGSVSITVDDIDGGSYDNCGVESIEASVLAFDCSNVNDNSVVLTVTDEAGNADSCIATVTVLDTIPPTFECPGPMDVSDCAGIVPDLISELEATDNCGGVTFTQDPAVGVAFGNVSGDTLVVTITATDINGNETSCEVVLTIIDEEDPYFQNCPGSVVFCNDVDECGAIVTWSQPVAFDNCDDSLTVLQTMGPAPGSFFPVGTVETIEYTATDDDGNSVTCTFTIEVEDCQNPDAICEDITIYVDEMGLATITADSINGGSYDNCAVESIEASITEFSCLEDTASMQPVADLVISGVVDATLPGGIPKAIEFYAQADIPDLSIYGFGSANNGGGSDGEEFTFPAGSVTAGTYLYLASETTAFMSFFGFAPDYTSSAALINGDDAVELFKDGAVIDVFGEIDVDGTGQPWEYTNGWTYRVSETGPDGTTFNIANWTFSGVNALNGETINATAATPFPIGTYTFTPPAPSGELVISGVVDATLPGGLPKAVEFYAQVDIPDLSIYGFGSANNGGGSDGEEFTFPAVSATAGQYIYVASESTAFMSFFGFAPDYTSSAANINGDDAIELFKNGAVLDVFGDINTDGTGQPWEYTNGWTYRISETGPDGSAFVLGNWTFSGTNALGGETSNATATAPFPIGTYTFTASGGGAPAIVGVLGPNQVVLTVTDAAGNTDSCVAIVTVLDTIPPEFECPADITVSGCSGTVPDVIAGLEGTDNCSEVTFSQNPLPNVTFGPNANDTIGIVITAVDESGNETTCEVIVTIIDDEMPYFQNCPDTLMVCNDVDVCGAKVNWIAPTAFDNCDDSLDVVQTAGPISGSIFPIGITEIEYTATDDDGNSVTCNFVVMVMDCQTPTAVCKDIFVFVDENCEFSIGAADIDGGSTDNCGIDTMLISLDGTTFVDSLTFDIDDLADPFVQVTLQVIDSAGNVSICVATVTVVDGTDPTIICQDDITVSTEPNVCYGLIPNIIPPLDTADNCSPIINLDQFPEPGLLFGSLPGDSLEVFVIATDIDGNMDTCSMFVFLEDNEPPAFINCPRPNIVVKAMPGMCGAFVNFSLPVALDNCGEPIVEQTDDTGLTSGDMFPVGLTILEYIAIDSSGNTDSCSLKIIVNDEQDPTIVCPDDLTVNNDPGECGAIVNDIAPVFVEDNCMTAVTYSITNEMWPDSILVAGIDDASGNYFECGENTVTYRVTDQPLLMFSEATHEVATINGGTDPLPPYVVTSGDDYVEIVNLGPASMDLSCLEIHRVHAAGTDSLIVPAYTVIGVGEVLVVHFGDGTDDPAQLFFNVPTTVDLSSGDAATYVMKFGEVLDVLAVNGATSPVGGFDGAVASMLDKASTYRKWAWDSDSYQDYAIADVCMPATIGSLNPDLYALADNADTVGLQSLPANTAECIFTVTMEDNEFPVCGEYNSYLYTGATNLGVQGSITGGTVFGSEISVTDNIIVGKVRLLNVQGTHPDMSDLMFKLTAPSGEKVLLFGELCAGTGDFNFNLDQDSLPLISAAPCGPLGQGGMYAADGDMSAFYGEAAFGTWTLEIADAVAANDGQLLNWEIEVLAQEAYSQTDTTIANLPGFCLAEFTWNHPILLDNCEEGTIVISYSTLDDIVVPNGGTVEGGAEITEYFEVGTTTITYTLTDKAGNVSECGFDVTVEDTEAPVAICPADITVSLTGGECSDFIHFNIDATDNCSVDSVVAYPPSGSEFEIGITEVVVIAYDPSGNTDTCTFLVEVIPYDPTSDVLVCNDDINVSLGPDCTAEITADMLLEGDDYFCYEDYCIEIVDEDGNIVVDNIFTLEHVGMTFTATVSDCLTGVNSCWTNIYVEHKVEPEIECPADTVVSCNSATDPSVLGQPVVLTCESSVDYDYVDVIEEFGMCDSILVRITRSWTVTNATGNTATCDQIIEVQKFELEDVEFPGDFVLANAFECSDVAADPSLTDPSNTGNPTINGEEVFGAHFCEVNVGYWDEILQDANCSNAYEILRHWVVRDECLPLEPGVNPLRHIQAIKVNDDTAPDLVCPDNMTISTSFTDCSGALILPDPQLTDNCDEDVEYTIRVSSGALVYNGAYWVLSNLQIGTHTVTYRAEDACGNVSLCSFEISVIDDVQPVALCDHSTNVSLGVDGTARVYWTSLDDGSYDNCFLDRIEVKRNTACGSVSAWREYVDFCCADLGDTVMVELGVWDIYGNFNSCWAGVYVDAKLPPSIVAPPDITVSCAYEFDLWDLSVFGTVETDASLIDDIYTDDQEYYSNCLNGQGANPIYWGQDGFAHGTCDIEVVENYNENLECGTGVITRVFKATAGTKSKTAVQKITIVDCSPFVTNDITWPRDYTSSSCYAVGPHHGPHPDDLPTINGWPRFDNEDNCSLVAATYEDQVFQFVDSACWKVLRTWSVIDWCQYDSNDPFTDGYWQHTQVIKLKNTVKPAFDPCEDITVCTDNVVDCTGWMDLPSNVTDDCTPYESLDISWKIDAFADGTYDIFSSQPGMTYDDASGYYPFGTHRIFWNVEDLCGNTNTCSFLFTVEDCKQPTPYCYNGLAIVVMPVMPNPMVDIWADDFDAGSFDNCCATEDLQFRIIRSEDNPNNVLPADDNNPATPYPEGMRLTCLDVLDVSTVVQIWVGDCGKDRNLNGVIEDNERNWDYCETYILVQDPNNACDTTYPGAIYGDIATEEAEWVDEVTVELSSSTAGFPSLLTTTDQGHYEFPGIPLGLEYTVRPEKDGDDLNGVETFDLVLIQQHILGLQQLNSYPKYIAADANDDDRISALDIIDLRKLILGIYDELPSVNSWRFADASYDFGNGIWEFPEEVDINLTGILEEGIDFTGIKIGDVDGTVQANLNSATEDRGNGLLELEIENLELEAGKEYEILVSSKDFNEISGMQWTYKRSGIEILEITGEGLEFSSQNYAQIERRGITYTTLSWNEKEAISREGDLFKLRVLALMDGRLSEMLYLNSDVTKSEAYRADGERISVTMKWTGLIEDAIFTLHQNEPNPWISETKISFEIPESGKTALRVYDATGRLIYVHEEVLDAGYHEHQLKNSQLGSAGIFMYKLDHNDQQLSKRMILVE